MVRTEIVELKNIFGIAYKQKLVSGGAGITVITPEGNAVATIDRRSGLCVPYGSFDAEVFTDAVFKEALDKTRGLPYRRLGKITKVHVNKIVEEADEDEIEEDQPAIDVLASAEYKEFIYAYTNKTGKFSYQVMNRDLMQFASKSSVVAGMVAEKTDTDQIVRYVVKSKAADLARNKGMSDEMLDAFIETMDSMNTRSAFKELTSYLRRLKAKR